MPDLFPPTIDDEIACVEREIQQRRNVYPRLIAAKKMTREFAEQQIKLMEAVLRRLQDIRNAGGA